jgi:hypothetical protein
MVFRSHHELMKYLKALRAVNAVDCDDEKEDEK